VVGNQQRVQTGEGLEPFFDLRSRSSDWAYVSVQRSPSSTQERRITTKINAFVRGKEKREKVLALIKNGKTLPCLSR